MRERIYKLVKPHAEHGIYGKIYDSAMIIVICLSLLPLMFKQERTMFDWLDTVAVVMFIIDYLLRWSVADYLLGKKGIVPFLKYPFTPIAIVDLLSILPSLTVMYDGFKLIRLVRLISAMKVIRVFKLFRYSKNVDMIMRVFKKQKEALITVTIFAIGYIFVSAIVIFQVEQNSFENFFDAVYWATILLTTVGYGDIIAVTTTGKIIAMISSFIGIAIVALPAGIITAGYMVELRSDKEEDE